MYETTAIEANSKPEFYEQLAGFAKSLLHGEPDAIANAANFSSLLYHSLPEVNWVGFYFLKEGELVVGPFNGKPACVRIPLGKGVCGTAAEKNATQRVADVDAFPGHIPCDGDSRSEIVVPLTRDGVVFGVLDIDSPRPDRFDAEDQLGIEALAKIVSESLTKL